MGLDFGEKTIGVALSDELFITAQPLETIKRTKAKEDIGRLKELIDKYEVGQVVIGLPKNMNNTLGPQAMRTLSFADLLKKEIDQEVLFQDERLTTLESDQVLEEMDVAKDNRKKYIDKIAASFILQTFLDRRNNG